MRGPAIFLGALALCGPFDMVPDASAQTAASSVSWHVADRFRLFDRGDPTARREVERLLDDIGHAAASGQTDMMPFYPRILERLAGPAARSLRSSNYAASPPSDVIMSGRYAADYLYPATYAIRVSAPEASPGSSCRWRVGEVTVTSRCGEWAELSIPARENGSGASAQLYVTVDTHPETDPVAVEIEDQLIVAMGDSYISGEGNPDVPVEFKLREGDSPSRFERSDWPARLNRGLGEEDDREYEPAVWWDAPCHRSLLSWPVLASFAHAARDRQRAVTLVHLGCSGDEVTDGLLRPRRELPGGGRERQSQFQMLADLRLRGSRPVRPVDRLLLAIGGNDVGFAYVVAGLLLPPNGWRLGGLAAREAGGGGPTACPYEEENLPLARFCGGVERDDNGLLVDRRSSELRFRELPDRLSDLGSALDQAGIERARVFQITYPNALIDEQGEVCRTVLSERDLAGMKRRIAWAWLIEGTQDEHRAAYERERAYAERNPGRVRAGFEALLAKIPANRRGSRLWNFQIQYYPEEDLDGPALDPAAVCDNTAEPRDSEVCQGLWVWSNLNEAIRVQARALGWRLIDSHQSAIRGHGWCNQTDAAPLRFPLRSLEAGGSGGWNGWAPNDFDPYDPEIGRWFRTTNDSALTQYMAPDRFHKGTMHPTYRAHLAIAQATLGEAFGD